MLLSLEASVSAGLAALWLSVMLAVRRSGYGIAFLSLGATVLHEILHLVVGLVLNAKPISVSLLPKKKENYWVLGSVGFENLNIWNAAFVTMAPLGMIPLGGVLFQHWMLPALLAEDWWSWGIAGYGVACCLFAGWPSRTDVKLGASSILMYGTVAYGLWRYATP